jgi:hypothetical protein
MARSSAGVRVLGYRGVLGYWAIGLLGYWAIGLLGYWAIGLLGYWAIGLLGYWSWSVGRLQTDHWSILWLMNTLPNVRDLLEGHILWNWIRSIDST